MTRWLTCSLGLALIVAAGCQSTARLFDESLRDARFVLNNRWDMDPARERPAVTLAEPPK